VPLDGELVTVQFEESLKTGDLLMRVWPPPKALTESEVPHKEQIMVDQAQRVVNFIGKHGGNGTRKWVFGLIEADAVYHHGLQDTEFAQYLPESKRRLSIQTEDGVLYTDHSTDPNKQELESKSDTVAIRAMTLINEVKTLKDGTKVFLREITELRVEQEEWRKFYLAMAEKERARGEYEVLKAKNDTMKEAREAIKEVREDKVRMAESNGAQAAQEPDVGGVDYIN
jgi:regulator of replication initiation timing